MRRVLLVLLLAIPLALLVPATSLAVEYGPGPGGEACSLDTNQFYNLQNSIHPGEIGIQTVLSCNKAATIGGGQQLQELLSSPTAHWQSIPGTAATKSKSNVLSLTMTSWFSCGGLGQTADSIYRGDPSWNVNFSDGYSLEIGDQYGPAFSTKCHSPVLAQFS